MRFLKLNTYLLLFLLPFSASAFNADIERVCFSPRGGCERVIISKIDQAQKEIRILAYSFTSAHIGKALIDAHRRGVDVQIVIDKGRKSERYSAITFFRNQGLLVFIDGQETIQHNKVMIIDGRSVITGSYNFTKAAETKNAENVLIIKSTQLAQTYLQNWQSHRNHSE